MFKKLFKTIIATHNDDIKIIYNKGVTELARGNINNAIELFEQVYEQHESAAYNLGLIYLDGAGVMLPNYQLSRKYFRIAHQLGHPRAEKTAQIIGLNENRILSVKEQFAFFVFSVSQYAEARQIGNLAYLVAYDIIHNVLKTTSHENYSLRRFIDYEVYCIRNYASDEVKAFYKTSNLIYFLEWYEDDWENGETAAISDYINESVLFSILQLSGGKVQFTEMGILRLAIVNEVYNYWHDGQNGC